VRVRVGVGPPHKPADGAQYLLAPFRKSDLAVIDESVEKAAEAVKAILGEGIAAAMNRFNRRPKPDNEGASGGGETASKP
jgi:PTH1 family peptidyl-tRNA hydrolase